MASGHVATSSVSIDGPASRAWDVITEPAAIKEFMFSADVVTDWTLGGHIVWRSQWKGKDYEDKGFILEVEPGQRLIHTHYSPLGGDADIPENYHTLTWTIEAQNQGTAGQAR